MLPETTKFKLSKQALCGDNSILVFLRGRSGKSPEVEKSPFSQSLSWYFFQCVPET